MKGFSSRPAGRTKKRRRSARGGGLVCAASLGFGGGHGRRIADCGHPPTKPGVSKGGLGLPFGTRPCLQGVVCYTCWRGCRCKRGAVRYAPRLHRQENGRGFCDREGTKSLSVFRERRQVYKPPSPVSCVSKVDAFCRKTNLNLRYISASPRPCLSSPACRQARADKPLSALVRRLFQLGAIPSQNPKEAGKHPWGLPALITDKQNRAGPSRLALKTPFISTLTASVGFAIFPVN